MLTLRSQQEWYRKAHELLLTQPFTPSLLDSAASESKIVLRPGCDDLLEGCQARAVPLVVCSAGLGNVIGAVLKHRLSPGVAAKVLPTLPIVSNWLHFDSDGVRGFSSPLMHMFNKNGDFIRAQLGERWTALSRGRDTALVLGDGLGDASMADGLGMATIIKIGFLNESDPERVAARLPKYEATFDLVVLNDLSFEVVLQLLGF